MTTQSVAALRSTPALNEGSFRSPSHALSESSFLPSVKGLIHTSRKHQLGSTAFRQKRDQMRVSAKLALPGVSVNPGVSAHPGHGRGSVRTKFATDHTADVSSWDDELRFRGQERVRRAPYIAEAAVGMVVCSARGCRPIFEAASPGREMEKGGVAVCVEEEVLKKKKPAYPDGFVDYLNEVWTEREVSQQLYEKELKQNPRSAKILASYAAFAYKEQGDMKLADRLYRQALQEAPEDADLLSSYALFLWQTEA